MKKTPKENVADPNEESYLQEQIREAIDGSLKQINLRALLGEVLSTLALAERKQYLSKTTQDKGNGSYERSLAIGSIPIETKVPRTRSGQFRPTLLPDKYLRSYPEETQAVLLGLLSSSRSVNAAKTALRKMGIPATTNELEAIASDFIEELHLRNTRPIEPDLLAVFIDGKYIEVRDDDRIRSGCIYVAVGLDRMGKKRILSTQFRYARENLEDWKKILRDLIERGLRRVMIIVQDDFSGLLPITKSLFPQSDVQLCIVHMQRNARSHLGKEDSMEFNRRLAAIKLSLDEERAKAQFDELCTQFSSEYPSFIKELKKKRDHYLCFLKYPEAIRRSFSTTNAVEAVNGQLERMRINNGGYFHSEEVLEMKLGIQVTYLENGKWRRVSPNTTIVLHQLNSMFDTRFESEK